jgi:hypothetical protein
LNCHITNRRHKEIQWSKGILWLKEIFRLISFPKQGTKLSGKTLSQQLLGLAYHSNCKIALNSLNPQRKTKGMIGYLLGITISKNSE